MKKTAQCFETSERGDWLERVVGLLKMKEFHERSRAKAKIMERTCENRCVEMSTSNRAMPESAGIVNSLMKKKITWLESGRNTNKTHGKKSSRVWPETHRPRPERSGGRHATASSNTQRFILTKLPRANAIAAASSFKVSCASWKK